MTTPTLTPDFIARQRTRLETLRDELLDAEQEATDTVRTTTEEQRDTAEDVEDTAQAAIQDGYRQSMHDRNQPRLAAIERALAKIDDGSYGRSDDSDEPIPMERLEAVPEATLTVEEAEAKDRAARTEGPR